MKIPKLGMFDQRHPLIQRPDTVLAWVGPLDEDASAVVIQDLQHQLRSEQKRNRKLQCRINRLHKLIPGRTRVWNLNRIAAELEAEAYWLEAQDIPHANAEGLREDALFINRLEYDLTDLVNEKNGGAQQGTGKYDPTQWPRGPRP